MSKCHQAILSTLLVLAGCSGTGTRPLATVPHVDLPRFMGDWYVIAHIPFFTERNAWNAVESYRLDDTGRVLTTFTFNEGAADGPRRRMTPVGYPVQASNNAVWGMQFIWPIRADFRIIHLDPGYETTIIARAKRDYAWIMARTPAITTDRYLELVQVLEGAGYDTRQLRRVPHDGVTPGTN